ncbi:MAG: hypothetical protein GWP35_10705, partial [Proteobacteria bacterium]|nr:hypothetical protein [Pseudomonadota bacterium]
MNLIDKILWGILTLIMLLALTWGLVIGLPSSIPDVALKSERISIEELRKNLTPDQISSLNENMLPAPNPE